MWQHLLCSLGMHCWHETGGYWQVYHTHGPVYQQQPNKPDYVVDEKEMKQWVTVKRCCHCGKERARHEEAGWF